MNKLAIPLPRANCLPVMLFSEIVFRLAESLTLFKTLLNNYYHNDERHGIHGKQVLFLLIYRTLDCTQLVIIIPNFEFHILEINFKHFNSIIAPE